MARPLLLALAALRGVLAVVAIPLAPALLRDHLAVLVLLRPSKEVLLFAGYALQQHDVSLGVVVAAALPLLVGAVAVLTVLTLLGRQLTRGGRARPAPAPAS